jgi:lysozyme family protein
MRAVILRALALLALALPASAQEPGFERALSFVLRAEGGYVDNPLDTGGETNYGVTTAVHDEWRVSKGLPKRSVRDIEQSEVATIYKTRYWLPAGCEALPWPVSLIHFDSAVNSGVSRAARLLQTAAGVTVDGKVGPATIAAAQAPKVPIAYQWTRLDWYARIIRSNPSQATFGPGWVARIRKLMEAT